MQWIWYLACVTNDLKKRRKRSVFQHSQCIMLWWNLSVFTVSFKGVFPKVLVSVCVRYCTSWQGHKDHVEKLSFVWLRNNLWLWFQAWWKVQVCDSRADKHCTKFPRICPYDTQFYCHQIFGQAWRIKFTLYYCSPVSGCAIGKLWTRALYISI